jgi:hypothetical protein
MTRTRREQLDAMSEADKEKDLLKTIGESGAVRIDCRAAMAFWGSVVQRLEDAGRVKTRFVENWDGQYSYLEVTLP